MTKDWNRNKREKKDRRIEKKGGRKKEGRREEADEEGRGGVEIEENEEVVSLNNGMRIEYSERSRKVISLS